MLSPVRQRYIDYALSKARTRAEKDIEEYAKKHPDTMALLFTRPIVRTFRKKL